MTNVENGLSGQRQSATRRSLHFGGLLLLLAMVGAGCDQAAKGPADINPGGSYTLVSIDGNGVPCSLKHGGLTMTVRSGAFTIKPDGTCSSKVTIAQDSGGDWTRDVKATFTRVGCKLTMKWEGAGTTTGTLGDDTFSMVNEGMTYLYRK